MTKQFLLPEPPTLNAQLVASVQAGLLEETSIFLAQGASPLARHPKTDIPVLHLACYFGWQGIAELLLDHGAKINETTRPDNDMAMPIHMAALGGNPKIIKTLVSRGANPKACDGLGQSALHYAARQIKRETQFIVDLPTYNGIEKIPAFSPTPDFDKTLDILLQHGLHPDLADSQGRTALHHLCEEGLFQQACTMIQKGASCHVMDKDRNLPFMMCAQKDSANHRMIMDRLLALAPDTVDQRNKDGQTALIMAVDKGIAENAEVLLQWGADRDQKDAGSVPVKHHVGSLPMMQVFQKTTSGPDVMAMRKKLVLKLIPASFKS